MRIYLSIHLSIYISLSLSPTPVGDAGQMASHLPFGPQKVLLLVLTNRLPRVLVGARFPPSGPSICSSIGNSQSPPDELESPPTGEVRGQTTCGDTFLASHCFRLQKNPDPRTSNKKLNECITVQQRRKSKKKIIIIQHYDADLKVFLSFSQDPQMKKMTRYIQLAAFLLQIFPPR